MPIENDRLKTKSPVPFGEISLPDRLLEMAMADLDSSMLLYENGYYPQSVFLLQQSVEKTCKSLSIFFEIITEKDASKQIGHKSLKIVKITTDEFTESVRDTCQKLADNPGLIPALDSLDDYDLTQDQIEGILAELKQQTDEAEKSLTKLTSDGISDSDYSEMTNKLYEMLRSFVISMKIPESHKSILIGLLPITISQIIPKRNQLIYLLQIVLTVLVCSIVLFHLARITAPHAVRSRYPNSNEAFDPLEYYSEESPLVINMPELFRYTQITIERVDLLFDLLSAGEPVCHNSDLQH
jgi:HEPN domain-containing protein